MLKLVLSLAGGCAISFVLCLFDALLLPVALYASLPCVPAVACCRLLLLLL